MGSSMPGDHLRYCCDSTCENCLLFEFRNSDKHPTLLFPASQLFLLYAVPVQLHDCSEFSFSSWVVALNAKYCAAVVRGDMERNRWEGDGNCFNCLAAPKTYSWDYKLTLVI